MKQFRFHTIIDSEIQSPSVNWN